MGLLGGPNSFRSPKPGGLFGNLCDLKQWSTTLCPCNHRSGGVFYTHCMSSPDRADTASTNQRQGNNPYGTPGAFRINSVSSSTIVFSASGLASFSWNEYLPSLYLISEEAKNRVRFTTSPRARIVSTNRSSFSLMSSQLFINMGASCSS